MSFPTTLVLDAGRNSSAPRISRSEQIVALAVIVLLFLEHLAFGAGRREVALAFCAAQGLALAAIVLAAPWARQTLLRPTALLAPASLFVMVFFVAFWSLTPWVPGGPHPIWTYVAAPPAAAIDKSAVLLQLIQLAGLACVFVIGWILGADDDRARYVLMALVVSSGVFAIWAFMNQILDPGILFGVFVLPSRGVRLSAAFLGANTAGAWFGVSALLSICAVTDRMRDRGRSADSLTFDRIIQRNALTLPALAFSIACLILTASRGAMAATAAALVLFLLWEALARRWRLQGLAGLGLLCLAASLVALLAIGGTPFFERLSTEASVAGRAVISTAHWRAFLASPWMGYGLGSFDTIDRLITTSGNYSNLWNIHAAHNVYLQWLEEGGVLGATPMFLCIAVLLANLIAGAGRRVRMTTWLRGLVAVSLVLLIHGTSDFSLQIPSISSFWAFLLGLGAAIAFQPSRQT